MRPKETTSTLCPPPPPPQPSYAQPQYLQPFGYFSGTLSNTASSAAPFIISEIALVMLLCFCYEYRQIV